MVLWKCGRVAGVWSGAGAIESATVERGEGLLRGAVLVSRPPEEHAAATVARPTTNASMDFMGSVLRALILIERRSGIDGGSSSLATVFPQPSLRSYAPMSQRMPWGR
jgi:hypothetical protein